MDQAFTGKQRLDCYIIVDKLLNSVVRRNHNQPNGQVNSWVEYETFQNIEKIIFGVITFSPGRLDLHAAVLLLLMARESVYQCLGLFKPTQNLSPSLSHTHLSKREKTFNQSEERCVCACICVSVHPMPISKMYCLFIMFQLS